MPKFNFQSNYIHGKNTQTEKRHLTWLQDQNKRNKKWRQGPKLEMRMLNMKSPMLKERSWILKPQVAIWTQFSNGPIYSTQTNKQLPSYKMKPWCLNTGWNSLTQPRAPKHGSIISNLKPTCTLSNTSNLRNFPHHYHSSSWHFYPPCPTNLKLGILI